MSNTSASNRIPIMVLSKHLNPQMQRNTNFADLQNELNRLRAVLTRETMLSHLIMTEPELFSDPIDQAAAEHELDVSLSVMSLTIEKLHRIERALMSLHARSYGICSHCSQEIPSARLKVQPDSLYCVPCLTGIEQTAARN